MTKVCISGYYGFKNFGDETILSVLLSHLKDFDVTVFSSNPDFTSKTYNVKSIRSFDMKNVVNAIHNTDVSISGGGSLLQDVTSLKSLIYYALIIGLGIVFDKKVKGGYVTLNDVQGEIEVYVSRLRQDVSVENGFSFWCVADNLRFGVAGNVYKIIRLWEK